MSDFVLAVLGRTVIREGGPNLPEASLSGIWIAEQAETAAGDLPIHRGVNSSIMAGAFACGACIFGLRAAAIHWNLAMPDWLATGPKSG